MAGGTWIDQNKVLPGVYDQFLKICSILENHYRDMQDMEFTIEKGKLYMLQTRNGKRTAAAAIRIACDLIDEGMITETEEIGNYGPFKQSLRKEIYQAYAKYLLEIGNQSIILP